jgi:hypothetical protein
LDGPFGTGGFKVAPNTNLSTQAHAMTLLADGTIILVGYANFMGDSIQHPFLMRFSGASSSPLLAAGGAALAAPDTQALTLSQVQPLVTEAIARWQATGADVSSLANLNVRVADLGSAMLGQAAGNTITLDDNAAGWGWFIDATPKDDSEFTARGDQGELNHMDLLSAVMHELGHILGLEHDDGGVMAETLAAGVRRTDLEQDHAALVDQVFQESGSRRTEAWMGAWSIENLDSTGMGAKRRR